ncbi:DUF2336 domain-containing protein [Ciceribacter sp. sgz301302]
MATVTGFESLRHPRRSDLRQFSELFEPLFLASSMAARRQAAAALSRCPVVPAEAALLIGTQPIAVAATFLTGSAALSDRDLIEILQATGESHAQAIARRPDLSPVVVDALVGHRRRPPPSARHAEEDEGRLQADERLRQELKALARAAAPAAPEIGAPAAADPTHVALLWRFARADETVLFTTALASALGSSRSLAERILLDVSGQQLAATLLVLAIAADDARDMLEAIYPHLAERLGAATRAQALLAATRRSEAEARIAAWLRADDETDAEAAANSNRPADEDEPAYGYGFRQGMRVNGW